MEPAFSFFYVIGFAHHPQRANTEYFRPSLARRIDVYFGVAKESGPFQPCLLVLSSSITNGPSLENPDCCEKRIL